MDNNIEVLVTMQDNASAGIRDLTSNLVASKTATRELAMGTAYLGSAFLGMAVAMKNSNIAAVQGMGNMLAMAGGMLSSIGAAAQFVGAISKMTSALQKFNITQVIANALSGPGGWAKLAIGGLVAGASIYGVTKMMQSSGVGVTQRGNITVTQNIAGSVVTERQLVDNVHKGLLMKQQRGSTGLGQ